MVHSNAKHPKNKKLGSDTRLTKPKPRSQTKAPRGVLPRKISLNFYRNLIEPPLVTRHPKEILLPCRSTNFPINNPTHNRAIFNKLKESLTFTQE